jgi:hypothetical protein
MSRAIAVASLVVLAAAPAAWAQAKPTVKIGYIPTDSFAALFLLADRHLPAAGINVETVRLAGGPEIVSQVATGQLQIGSAGMGAAGFNGVVSGLPVPDVLKKARPHALDPNLEMDASVLDSMQKFNAELGYLKYKELQPVGKLFNFAYRDRAVQELGRK